MQTCYNCGRQVSDETLICPECGALVKRYEKPVPPAETDLNGQEPVFAQAPAPRRTAVYSDAQGRTRFSGLLTAWLIVCAAFAGYQALSYGCLLVVYHNQALYSSFFSAAPEFADFLSVYNVLMQDIAQFYGVYVGILIVSILKCAGYIWLCAGKRRLALWTVLASDAALVVLMLLFGNSYFAGMYAIEPLATFLFVRRGLKLLR